MSIQNAYNSLLHSLSRKEKARRIGDTSDPEILFRAPTKKDVEAAKAAINAMSSTDLLEALISHEEPFDPTSH